MQAKNGFVGLGIMGGAMAEALLERGYEVNGYDVAPAAVERLERAGGKGLGSARAVAEASDIVITALATAAALDATAEDMAPRCARPSARPSWSSK